ncbi:hypothetical protein HELRODRAFT_187155 [Helobdella robusta]|uniref:Mitoferrin-1 n=1 Tax=Helobdella robusta TaxID=6412 RepID=T1FP73_HELRO|nr:hypothetical protein HELRODRAFT_187155 [Helobdella robusta]ESO01372.1 hypothetical protein HELRODRAFT_187155 [Helobdella robusta]
MAANFEEVKEEDDYESLPGSTSASVHMVAGAFAGLMEHCVMYPFDFVKTRMQAQKPDPRANYRNMIHAFYKIIRYEGPMRTVRGINATIYGAGPAHALYFAAYEKSKKILNKYTNHSHLTPGLAGIGATLLHDAIMTPAEVVKQRMQVYNSPYKSCLDCARCINRREGPRAFYRSYLTQLSMNIPFQCTHFIFYELGQDFLNENRHYNPKSHIISGALAGAVAAAVTTPLDVCKTLLNTQEGCSIGVVSLSDKPRTIKGLFAAGKIIYSHNGIPGFFKGVSARVVYQMPSTALAWSVYEFFKHYITKNVDVNK